MYRLLLIGVVVIGAFGCAGSESSDPTADAEAIRQLIDRAVQVNNQSDAEGFADLFTEDAVVMPQGAPAVQGRDAILAGERQGNAEFFSAVSITPVEVIIAGDWAFVRTGLTGTKTPVGGGEPIPVDAKELVILRRQDDGRWKIARLIGNTNRPSYAWHSPGEAAEGNASADGPGR